MVGIQLAVDLRLQPHSGERQVGKIAARAKRWICAGSIFEREGKIARLMIDPGVLRAFLEVRSYRHGARSLETIVAMSTLHGQSRYERSALPARRR